MGKPVVLTWESYGFWPLIYQTLQNLMLPVLVPPPLSSEFPWQRVAPYGGQLGQGIGPPSWQTPLPNHLQSAVTVGPGFGQLLRTELACNNDKAYQQYYCSVLFKWEFFIQMRASGLSLSFRQKRGVTERGWVQNRPFSFEWNALIWIGHHCTSVVRFKAVNNRV